MAKFNKKGSDSRVDATVRLAGGMGAKAATQNNEMLLRRVVMSCMLFEDVAYESGEKIVGQINKLIPLVDGEKVAGIAISAAVDQKLRHVPIWIALQMLKYPDHRKFVRGVLNAIIRRADQMTDIVALYLNKTRGEKHLPNTPSKLPRQLRLGLADVFHKFDEYQLAKYNRANEVKLKDVLRLCHAKPTSDKERDLWGRLLKGELKTPDTWEVALSTNTKGEAGKKESWERLIETKKLGGLALLRNLRNMQEQGVDHALISKALNEMRGGNLLPLNFLAAAKINPRFISEIEQAMLRALANHPKLPGETVLVIDVSGSMQSTVSHKSDLNRMEAAAALAMLAREVCKKVSVYATAGEDYKYQHATVLLPAYRGFAIADAITQAPKVVGGGGIFTRQCLEWIYSDRRGSIPERIIVFSDSQDCDRMNKALPKPFGRSNYIIDVGSHTRGVNYEGVWTAEIAGWSEAFLRFVFALEGINVPQGGDEDAESDQLQGDS